MRVKLDVFTLSVCILWHLSLHNDGVLAPNPDKGSGCRLWQNKSRAPPPRSRQRERLARHPKHPKELSLLEDASTCSCICRRCHSARQRLVTGMTGILVHTVPKCLAYWVGEERNVPRCASLPPKPALHMPLPTSMTAAVTSAMLPQRISPNQTCVCDCGISMLAPLFFSFSSASNVYLHSPLCSLFYPVVSLLPCFLSISMCTNLYYLHLSINTSVYGYVSRHLLHSVVSLLFDHFALLLRVLLVALVIVFVRSPALPSSVSPSLSHHLILSLYPRRRRRGFTFERLHSSCTKNASPVSMT